MEHVTEGLYLAAAAGLFALAVSLLLLTGRGVDALFDAVQEIEPRGVVLRAVEETSDE